MIQIKTSDNKNVLIEYNTRLSSFTSESLSYSILPNNKIKQKKIICPICKSHYCRENGYYAITHKVIRELGMKIYNAQYECKRCHFRFHTHRELIDNLINSITEFVKSLLTGCARLNMPFESTSNLIREKIGVSYCGEYVRQLYNDEIAKIKEEKIVNASGLYHYDEQFLVVNGREVCRLTIIDAVTNKIIADVQTDDVKEETIKKVIMLHLKDLKVDCFILDLARHYPNILHELFPNAKIQWCIFHLYKLIWKEINETYGKNIPLHELYNTYLLFDVFFDHSLELKKIESIMKQYEQIKTKDEKSNGIIQKELIIRFRQFVMELKKERRREKQKIQRRTLVESEIKFDRIYSEKLLFCKKIAKRIDYIKENWDRFTVFQKDNRVPPTNNGVEQYFAATLSKTGKKDFRSLATIHRDLQLFKAQWNGTQTFASTSLVNVLKKLMPLLRAFAPT